MAEQSSIAVLVVAYNAEATLEATLDRIPESFWDRISVIIVSDDASADATYERGLAWSERNERRNTLVLRHTKNLGYGGNQKAGYALALEHGVDVVVLLHADGQYAPEALPEMVAPFADPGVDAVFGSRMMVRGAARSGGMPLYKWVGNRVLTTIENAVVGSDLTEFHSGYRAYRTSILARVPFAANSDDFDFDTQIIAQVLHAGGRIVEIPIPTFYGDEICYVNGLGYARDVLKDVLEYRITRRGLGTSEWVVPDPVTFEAGDDSSSSVILEMLGALPPGRVLQLRCGTGELSDQIRRLGHQVVGVDDVERPGVRSRVDAFHVTALDAALPPEVGTDFDVVLVDDTIEHVASPVAVLRTASAALRPGGQVVVSVPNFSHWYPRLRVSTGLFGYDRRGILDETHLRFFTRRTLRRLVRRAGFDVLEERGTPIPLGGSSRSPLVRMARALDRWLAARRPTLFAFQHVVRLTPHASTALHGDIHGQVDRETPRERDDAARG